MPEPAPFAPARRPRGQADQAEPAQQEAPRLLHGVKVGRVAGIEVRLDWSVAVIVWLLAWSLAGDALPSAASGYSTWVYWTVGAAAAVLFVLSLLAHELSHSVVAQHHGVEVRDITLWMLGGMSSLSGEPNDAGTEFRIAAAGPLTSLAISIGSFAVAIATAWLGLATVLVVAWVWLGTINGILAVFNLVPAAPLDGGRILTAVLWRRRGDHASAVMSAARAGRFFGVALVGLGLVEFALGAVVSGIWLAFVGWFMLSVAHAEERTARVRYELRRPSGESERIVRPPLPTSPPSRHGSFRV